MKIIIVGNGKVGYAIANSLAQEDPVIAHYFIILSIKIPVVSRSSDVRKILPEHFLPGSFLHQ